MVEALRIRLVYETIAGPRHSPSRRTRGQPDRGSPFDDEGLKDSGRERALEAMCCWQPGSVKSARSRRAGAFRQAQSEACPPPPRPVGAASTLRQGEVRAFAQPKVRAILFELRKSLCCSGSGRFESTLAHPRPSPAGQARAWRANGSNRSESAVVFRLAL